MIARSLKLNNQVVAAILRWSQTFVDVRLARFTGFGEGVTRLGDFFA